MHVIGLIGGIASGKSRVADLFKQRGAYVISADEYGHQALIRPDVRRVLVDRWGAGVLDASGWIDRKAVASIVFAPTPEGTAERKFLEQLVHPIIRGRMEWHINSVMGQEAPANVIDAALLLEAGWDDLCTAIVFVDCPREKRFLRARVRRWTEEEFTRREAAQLPIEEKRRRATHVIDNSGWLADLDAQVASVWSALGLPLAP